MTREERMTKLHKRVTLALSATELTHKIKVRSAFPVDAGNDVYEDVKFVRANDGELTDVRTLVQESDDLDRFAEMYGLEEK